MMALSAIASIMTSLVMMLIVTLSLRGVVASTNNKIVVRFLLYLFLLDIGLWYLLPSLLRLLSLGRFEEVIGILPEEISFVYYVELVSVCLFFMMVSFIAGRGRLSYPKNHWNLFDFLSRDHSWLSKNESNLLFFAGILCLLVYIDSSSFNFLSSVVPAIILESSGKFFLAFTVGFLFLSDISKIKFYGLFSVLLGVVLVDTLKGSHGSIVWPMIVIYFLMKTKKPSKALNITIFGSILLLLTFYKPLHDLRAYEYSLSEPLTPLAKLAFLVSPEDIGVDSSVNDGGLIGDIEWRFGENTRMSVGYLRMYERGFSGGLTPVINTLYLLPRSISPDKPVPASVDGEITGMGMYLMHNEMRGTTNNMSGMAPSMHEYWLGGWTAVLISAIAVGSWYAFVIIGLLRLNGLALPCCIALHDTWWQMPKLWSTEAILTTTNTIPLIMFWFFLAWVCTKVVRIIAVSYLFLSKAIGYARYFSR